MSVGTSTADARAELRRWVLSNARHLSEESLTETTPLLEARHLSSLHVPELLLLLEGLRQQPIDLASLRPGDLKDLRTIHARFLPGAP